MARQVLPIVGQAVGGYFGGPWGAMIGGMIGSALGNAVDPLIVKGPKLGEAGLQTSAEGVYRPIVFGTGAVKGNIICRGNRYIKIKRQQQDKGTGPKTETERVYWTFAIRICEAADGDTPVHLIRVWQDEKLVCDMTPETTIPEETVEFLERVTFYDGREDQLPDPDLELFIGVGNTPAYRGTCYMVFPNWDLTDLGERIPDFRFEIATEAGVVEVDALMTIEVSSLIVTGIPSPDGVDWSEDPYPTGTVPSSARQLIASGNRYIAFDLGVSPAHPKIGTNRGTTWVDAAGGTFTFRGPASGRGDVIAIPCDGGVAASMDYGSSFELRTTPVAVGGYSAMSLDLAVTRSSTHLVYTTNLYTLESWLVGDELRLDPTGGGFCVGSDTEVRYGGRRSDDPTRAAICWTTNGLHTEEMDVPVEATGEAQAGDTGVLNGQQVWLVGTQDGHLLVDQGDGWEYIAPVGVGGVVKIRFVTTGFLIVYSGTGTFFSQLYYTEDFVTFDNVTPPGNGGILDIAVLVTPPIVTGEPVPLSDAVAKLCRRAGLPASRYLTTNLTDEVDGIVLADGYTCAEAIRTLMPVYSFDAAEYDDGGGYKLHFPKRGRPVELTLTIDDLVDYPDKTVRQDAYERPRVLHMAFQSPTVGYAPAKASPMRFSPDVMVVGEQSVSVPVAFRDVDEAWRRADVMLKQIWTGIAGEEEFTITDQLLRLVPTDAVGVYLRGQVRRMLITEQSIEGGMLKCKLVADRQSNYTSSLTGVPLPPPTSPPPSIASATVHLPLDIPALNDNNDRLGSYQAATGQNEAWYGASIEVSKDGGANYSDLTTFTQNSMVGVLQNQVFDAAAHYTDTTNSLVIVLYRDEEIPSITDAQFLSEGGALAVSWEDSGARRWEIMQYRDAEQNSDGNWVLSHLLRGRLNSETAEHLPGAFVVLLDTVQFTNNVTADLAQDLTYRATSFGRSSDAAPVYTEEYTGESQREWPVAHLFLELAGSTLNARAVPRHRFGTEVNPVRSANWTGYRWTASDGVNSATVESLADTASFDVSGWGSPITVAVAQLNRITGAGPEVIEEIS